MYVAQPEAEFLDEIQTKGLRVFLLAIHSHLYSFALRFLFLKTYASSYIFLQTHTTSNIFLQLIYCTL
jgi:hypothetical protein